MRDVRGMICDAGENGRRTVCGGEQEKKTSWLDAHMARAFVNLIKILFSEKRERENRRNC